MRSGHFAVTCETEFVLCRTALWDCLRHAIFFCLHERLGQNSSPRQSHSAIRQHTDPVSCTTSNGPFPSSINSHFQNEAKKMQCPYVTMTKFRQYLVTGGVRLHEISVCWGSTLLHLPQADFHTKLVGEFLSLRAHRCMSNKNPVDTNSSLLRPYYFGAKVKHFHGENLLKMIRNRDP